MSVAVVSRVAKDIAVQLLGMSAQDAEQVNIVPGRARRDHDLRCYAATPVLMKTLFDVTVQELLQQRVSQPVFRTFCDLLITVDAYMFPSSHKYRRHDPDVE
eukprot:7715145-Pyramimonas_sp.AAC.1